MDKNTSQRSVELCICKKIQKYLPLSSLGYLVIRGSSGGLPVLKFFHRQFWEVAEAKFLATEESRIATAVLLARYCAALLGRCSSPVLDCAIRNIVNN